MRELTEQFRVKTTSELQDEWGKSLADIRYLCRGLDAFEQEVVREVLSKKKRLRANLRKERRRAMGIAARLVLRWFIQPPFFRNLSNKEMTDVEPPRRN